MKLLQATKWVSIQTLLELEELKSLFSLSSFKIVPIGRVVSLEKKEISKTYFFEVYGNYLDRLKNGDPPITQEMREAFSSCLTKDDFCIKEQKIQDKVILRPSLPVIQLQISSFHVSKETLKIFPQVFGQDTLSFGLYISFPQLYEDEEGEPQNSRNTPNGELFKQFQKWTREHTIPTCFLIEDTKVNTSLRLGKKCLSFINTLPQMKNLKVVL
jgi:hypothetical protein